MNPAKAMAMTVVDLLADSAARARRLLDEHHPALTNGQYLELMRGLTREEQIEASS